MIANIYTEEINLRNKINEARNKKVHQSIIKILNFCKIMMIVAWVLTIFLIGFYIIAFTSALIGIQFIRRQQVKKGLLIAFLGGLTFGIWPFIEALKLIKNNEQVTTDYNDNNFKLSLLKGYEVGLFLSIIGILTIALGIGFIVIIVATYIIGVQHIRNDRMMYGILMIIFGPASVGIWPLIDSYTQRKKLKREIIITNI